MKLLSFFFFTLVSFSVALAEPIQGYDVLGMAKYCNRFLGAPPLPAFSTLLNTFGDPIPCIRDRIQKGGVELIQIDLIDATCWRNSNCPPGVPHPDDLTEIKKRAKQVREKLVLLNPGIIFWLSPALEHDIQSKTKVKQMMEAAKEGCPECKIINSPVSGAIPDEYPIERHGTKVKSFSVSSDGASAFDGDNIWSDNNNFQHRIAGGYTTFVWFNELNLRCTGEENFIPPKLRTEKPTPALFKQAYQTLQPEEIKPPAPSFCVSVRDIQKGKEITKPNAEARCNGQSKDPRGNKPLLIIKKPGHKGDKLNVFRSDGKKVGQFCYYGTYASLPGTHRWYLGEKNPLCSGSSETPAQLYDDLDDEWGFVNLGSGKCLRFNAIRRQGIYR